MRLGLAGMEQRAKNGSYARVALAKPVDWLSLPRGSRRVIQGSAYRKRSCF